jgi:hypothetical protein
LQCVAFGKPELAYTSLISITIATPGRKHGAVTWKRYTNLAQRSFQAASMQTILKMSSIETS